MQTKSAGRFFKERGTLPIRVEQRVRVVSKSLRGRGQARGSPAACALSRDMPGQAGDREVAARARGAGHSAVDKGLRVMSCTLFVAVAARLYVHQ